MTYYNVYSAHEHATLPASYPDVLGSPDWPLHYARGWRELLPFVVPDGYATIPGTRRIEVNADVPCEVWDIDTADAAQERAEVEQASRIAALLPVYGAHVARLRGLLVQIGLDIPTTREEATERVLALVDGGNQAAMLLGLGIERQYEMLAPVQADVHAIWDAIRVQVGP